MKHILNINEAISGTVSTDNLWVVKTYINIDISTVYASKRTAQNEKDRLDKDAIEYYKKIFNSKLDRYDTLEKFIERNSPKYKVVTLYDAIEEIKEYIIEETEDSHASRNEPDY